MKYEIQRTSLFKKDYKRVQKRGCDIELLKEVIIKLANGEELPPKNKDHSLSGDWEGYRECHIQSDWLLIYRIIDNKLILSLTRTGTHSDFNF